MEREFLDIEVEGVRLRVAAMHRDGPRAPVVLLHGFGSTKEDYADVAGYPQFDGRPILAFDAPGCGETDCADLSALSIPFLQQTAARVLERYGLRRFHLVGHSMGGLTALAYARAHPDRPLSFVDIEGNLAPEDCFLSRQVADYPAESPAAFLEAFIERLRRRPGFSHPLYAAGLRGKVRCEAVAPIFRSMVALSDGGGLLDGFLGLPFPRMFVYGSENRALSYLPVLREAGVELAEIPESGHFPMYANPPALWTRIGAFLDGAEEEDPADGRKP